jgi:hypothetical protein
MNKIRKTKLIGYLCFFQIFLVKAQVFISVNSPSVVPQQPLTTSIAKIATRVVTPSIGWKVSSNFVIDNINYKINLKSYYCDGALPGGLPIYDTISIGTLAAGVWTLNFNAYYGSQIFTNCNVSDSVLKSITFTVSTSSSLKEVADNLINVNVYPNPSKGIFNLNSTFTKNQNLTISVTDLLGRELLVKNQNALQGENNFKLDLSTFQEGVYFVNFKEAATNFKTVKIIKY